MQQFHLLNKTLRSIFTKLTHLTCNSPRIFVQHVSARGDELVRSVVLVGGDEECAAEAGTGFADCAAEGVFIRTTPTRGVETRRSFIGLGPVRPVFVGRLHDAVETRFLGATVGVGDGRVRHSAVGAERADGRPRFETRRRVGCVKVARFDTCRVGCGDGAAQRVVNVGLGLGEVARCDRTREDAILGIVGRSGRRVRADAAAGLLSLSSCRHAQRHIHFDIFTGS